MAVHVLNHSVVNEATGYNSSTNDSSLPFSPLVTIQVKLRIATTENSGLKYLEQW